jgi:hypothetical protein
MVRIIWVGWFLLLAGLALFATVSSGRDISQLIPLFALLGITFVTVLFFFGRK